MATATRKTATRKTATRKTTTRQTSPRKTTTPSRPALTQKAAPAAKRARPASKPAAKRVTAAKAKPLASPALATPAGQAQAAAVAVPAAPAPAKTQTKAERVKKPKLVRDSFTIPKAEYAAIDAIKQRATKLGASPKKSELLRAGLMLLSQLSDAALSKALSAVPAIKTGRPKA